MDGDVAEQREMKELGFEILECLQSFMQNEILNQLPREPVYDDVLLFDASTHARQHCSIDLQKTGQIAIARIGKYEEFLKKFFQTQIFSFYMQKKFDKN